MKDKTDSESFNCNVAKKQKQRHNSNACYCNLVNNVRELFFFVAFDCFVDICGYDALLLVVGELLV